MLLHSMCKDSKRFNRFYAATKQTVARAGGKNSAVDILGVQNQTTWVTSIWSL